jgi:hypothetical protein
MILLTSCRTRPIRPVTRNVNKRVANIVFQENDMSLRNLFAASWQQGGPAWVARHNLTSAQYQAAFDQFTRDGFRLVSVSGYQVGPETRYAALWDKRPTGPWAARHGLTGADYQRTFDDLARQGYRLRLVNGYAIDGQDHYAAIWEKAEGPGWAARHGMTGADYQAAFNDLTSKGHHLVWVSTWAAGGQARYAALWEQGGAPAWVARHGLEEAAFRATHADLAAKGYDLLCASAASVNNADFYAALWQQTPAASIAHHGMTGNTYQLKFDQLAAQGYRPRFVAGYPGADPVDVVLNFTMQRQTQGNWCWAATSTSISRFYNSASPWTQCLVANAQKGVGDCCGAGASGTPCNTYGSLSAALTTTGNFVSASGGTTSFADTQGQVLQGRPLGIRVAWGGGGAHFIAATGTEDDSLVWVSDCGSGTTALVDYATLCTSYNGSGTWTHSYFTQP